MSKQSFADLGVSSVVRDALSRRGITAPFPVQSLVIEDVLRGRDVLVKAPTGSGKTLAFGVPLVERLDASAGTATGLVVAPTRELAAQIVAELTDLAAAKDLRVAAVHGGVGIQAQAARAKRAHILVATPGRLEDLLARGTFTLAGVQVLVLDEADRMLDMGFRPAIDRIVGACPASRQTLFCSATLDGLAGDVASRYTSNAIVREQQVPRERAEALVEDEGVFAAVGRGCAVLPEPLDVAFGRRWFAVEEIGARGRPCGCDEDNGGELESGFHRLRRFAFCADCSCAMIISPLATIKMMAPMIKMRCSGVPVQ